jgi:hypothetical protein
VLGEAMRRRQGEARPGKMRSFLSVHLVQHLGAQEKLVAEHGRSGGGRTAGRARTPC